MPCDTPPPPAPMEERNEEIDADIDDALYDFIEDANEFLEANVIDDVEEEEEEEEIVDDSIKTFYGHTDPVLCCNFDKTGEYIVTGGQDDTAFVWNASTKTIKFKCTGHSDSVIEASFSPDSKYVATADMIGLIQVWTVEDGNHIWDFEATETQFLRWLNMENSFVAGNMDGCCYKWTMPDCDTAVFPNPNSPCTAGCISHDDQKLVTGYSDGTLKFWNIPDNNLLSTISKSTAHNATVITILFNTDNTLILTGAQDGKAKVIKTSDFKVIWTINGCESIEHPHAHLIDPVEEASVEAVGFCYSLPYVVIGTNCGTLSIWDLNTKTRRSNIECGESITKITCDKLAPIIFAAYFDGKLQAHDARTGNVVKTFLGHKDAILDLSISSDCRLILTASDDTTCKVFQRGVIENC